MISQRDHFTEKMVFSWGGFVSQQKGFFLFQGLEGISVSRRPPTTKSGVRLFRFPK